MANKTLNFTVDTLQNSYTIIGTVKQLDTLILNVQILEQGQAKDLTGQTIKLFARKGDKNIVEQKDDIVIVNPKEGKITIKLKNAAVQYIGFVAMELEISDATGIISTATFMLRVNEKVGSDEAIESTNEVATLKEIEIYVAQAKVEIEEFKILQTEMLAGY